MLDLHFYLCEKIIKFALWSMNMIVNRAGILTFQNYRIKSIINALILYELMPPVAMNLRSNPAIFALISKLQSSDSIIV